MSRTTAEVQALQAQGLSQAAIGKLWGLSQGTINKILAKEGLTRHKSRPNVNRARRDGLIEVEAVELWEPYRIINPTVARLFSERHNRPASCLRIGRGIR